MKKVFFICLIVLFACGCMPQSNEDIVLGYFDAHNAHDIEKELSFYSEDVVFELKGVWTKSGLAEMRTLAEWDASLNSHLALQNMKMSGDSVFCQIVENNDWFKEANIIDLVHDPVIMIVKDSTIQKIYAYPNQETSRRIGKAIGELYQWSAIKKDSTIFELIKDNQFIYSSEAAQKWLELFAKKKAGSE